MKTKKTTTIAPTASKVSSGIYLLQAYPGDSKQLRNPSGLDLHQATSRHGDEMMVTGRRNMRHRAASDSTQKETHCAPGLSR
jgi:hypothetical protein